MPKPFEMTDAHMQAFSAQQRRRFEDEMVVHLRKEFPDETADLGEDGLRGMIREGIDKAKGYTITLERDVARYLELMLALSPTFDDGEEYPWAPDILKQGEMTGRDKIERIYEHIMFGRPAEPSGGTD